MASLPVEPAFPASHSSVQPDPEFASRVRLIVQGFKVLRLAKAV